MNNVAKLTPDRIEELAVEIRTFLLGKGYWQDTDIYFNGKCFSTHDKKTDKYYYNDPEHLVVNENEDPSTYFEYVNPEHILSMSFEGPTCEMIYYGVDNTTRRQFDQIFEKYGLYYEMGNHWNLSCYYI